MEKIRTILCTVVICVVLGGCSFFVFTPMGRGAINSYENTLKRVDDVTTYKTKKEVEDQCRAMIASYQTNKIRYESYKDSTDKTEQSWATAYKNEANKTATIYNEYITKNTYVFQGNIPSDIDIKLAIIE